MRQSLTRPFLPPPPEIATPASRVRNDGMSGITALPPHVAHLGRKPQQVRRHIGILLCVIRSKLAIAACKSSAAALRLLGRGGTNLPGRIALAIDPSLLATLSRGMHVTVVTGTNGKTTTSRMIEEMFTRAGYAYFANKSGANLFPGITGVFAQHSPLVGASGYTHALIECDEAAFRTVSQFLPVDTLIVNNIFRDQLDRFGEISHTLEAIRTGIANIPDATLCLNADCSLTSSLADGVPNRVVWFGVNTPIYKDAVAELSDAPYCIKCKTEYEYGWHTFGHLGGFACPNCGYSRHTPDVAVTEVLSTGASQSHIRLDIAGSEHEARINLPGGYNIYNAAGATTVAHVGGIDDDVIIGALGTFECGFGRAEEIEIGATRARMMLVKNPAGFNQVINLIANDEGTYQLAFVLNDRFADGTDISWIWDVDFEALARTHERFERIVVGGVRADDMAVRLKYASFPTERLEIMRSDDAILDALGESETPTFIMPTYTAMFDMRTAISRRTELKAFYE